MPRIAPRLVNLALRHDPLLATLLPICRTLESASNELRWLRESLSKPPDANATSSRLQHQLQLRDLVRRRAKGEPLQYILGTEYFGDLEINCRPGVLIPRQETAASIQYLVDRLARSKACSQAERLRILDLCTGTGCIPLLLHHDLYEQAALAQTELELVGVDVSSIALELAGQNLDRQTAVAIDRHGVSSTPTRSLQRLQLLQADILAEHDDAIISLPTALAQLRQSMRQFDILISNPPYISQHHFKTVTASSVRQYEPRLALVPEGATSMNTVDGDQFYPRLWQISDQVDAQVALFEVGDHEQALRVATMAVHTGRWEHIEIWRDHPSEISDLPGWVDIASMSCPVIGSGHSRSVFAVRERGRLWMNPL